MGFPWSRIVSCHVAVNGTSVITQDGEAITWTATGVGKFGPGGAVSYRGMLFFRTTFQKLARISNACGAFEYEVDPSAVPKLNWWVPPRCGLAGMKLAVILIS